MQKFVVLTPISLADVIDAHTNSNIFDIEIKSEKEGDKVFKRRFEPLGYPSPAIHVNGTYYGGVLHVGEGELKDAELVFDETSESPVDLIVYDLSD